MQPSIKLSYFWCTSNWIAWHPIFKDFISLLESGKNILKSTLSPCYSKYVPWPLVALAPPETLLEMQTLRTFSRSAAGAAKSLQLCPTLCNPIDGSPPGSARPWNSPGKNIGVGCHFLLQCMKVKSESEVAQSCPTLSDPMDCSLPGSSVYGRRSIFISSVHFPGKSTGVGCHCLLRL